MESHRTEEEARRVGQYEEWYRNNRADQMAQIAAEENSLPKRILIKYKEEGKRIERWQKTMIEIMKKRYAANKEKARTEEEKGANKNRTKNAMKNMRSRKKKRRIHGKRHQRPMKKKKNKGWKKKKRNRRTRGGNQKAQDSSSSGRRYQRKKWRPS